jgi:cytidyltransferase-like protein
MWDKINHGLINSKIDNNKYALFIGRFQPFHKGHIDLIDQKISQNIPVLIMIRDIIPCDKNPLTAMQSKCIIDLYYKSIGKKIYVKTIIIDDIESVNYGRGVGYEVNEFIPPENICNISATNIREAIKNNSYTWKNDIPKELHDIIYKFLKV